MFKSSIKSFAPPPPTANCMWRLRWKLHVAAVWADSIIFSTSEEHPGWIYATFYPLNSLISNEITGRQLKGAADASVALCVAEDAGVSQVPAVARHRAARLDNLPVSRGREVRSRRAAGRELHPPPFSMWAVGGSLIHKVNKNRQAVLSPWLGGSSLCRGVQIQSKKVPWWV